MFRMLVKLVHALMECGRFFTRTRNVPISGRQNVSNAKKLKKNKAGVSKTKSTVFLNAHTNFDPILIDHLPETLMRLHSTTCLSHFQDICPCNMQRPVKCKRTAEAQNSKPQSQLRQAIAWNNYLLSCLFVCFFFRICCLFVCLFVCVFDIMQEHAPKACRCGEGSSCVSFLLILFSAIVNASQSNSSFFLARAD